MPTFGETAGFHGLASQVNALAVFDDGSGPALYAGGSFTWAGGALASGIAKWDGVRWSALGGGVHQGTQVGVVDALLVHDDGSGPALFVGGAFDSVDGVPANDIAKWDGVSWSALGTGTSGSSAQVGVAALAVFDDGTGSALYVGGDVTSAGGVSVNGVAKWDGATWSSLSSGVKYGAKVGEVRALLAFDDGTGSALYVGGKLTSAGGVPALGIAKWDGSLWSAVGAGFMLLGGTHPIEGVVQSLVVYDDGGGPALHAGGTFAYSGANATSGIAKWDGSNWLPLQFGLYTYGQVFTYAATLAVWDDGTGPALYVGGEFMYAGLATANNVARWDGTTWSTLGNGVQSSCRALAPFDHGTGPALFAGGGLSTADGLTVEAIATWRPTGWSAVGSGLNESVFALEAFDDGTGSALYAGGRFAVDGEQAKRLIARWDGAHWAQVGMDPSGFSGTEILALTVYDDGNGSSLYAGGTFTKADGVSAMCIAKWDGAVWSPLGAGVGNSVHALAVFDDGAGPALYAAGPFVTAGGGAAQGVAKWNGSTWSALGSGVQGTVESLAVHDDGTGPALYAAGYFSTAGGVSATNIAKWNGSTWSAVGNGLTGYVYDLVTFDDGSGEVLCAAGMITASGGVPAKHLVAWDGSSWATIGGGLDQASTELAVHDDGNGPKLYVAGEFSVAGGVPANRIARWDGSTWSALGGGIGPGAAWADDQAVSVIESFDDGTGDALYVGGAFVTCSGGDGRLARWGCPLSTSGPSYCVAGTTSSGCVPAISAVGVARASAGFGFTVSVADVEGARHGLLFYGVSGGQVLPFGAASTSFVCVKPPTQRMAVQSSGGTLGACDGSFSIDWNAYIASTSGALGAPFVGGETVWAQAWFRDPGAALGSNLSDGLVFQVAP